MATTIPTHERKVLAAALVFAGAQLALIAFAAVKLGITVPSCVTNVKPFTEGQVIPLDGNRYEVHVVSKMWEYAPAVIEVPVGSTVDFYVVSKDVTHGFYIDNTNVNLMALPGVVNYAQAHFKQAGTYAIRCHEFCGTGHHAMAAVVNVK